MFVDTDEVRLSRQEDAEQEISSAFGEPAARRFECATKVQVLNAPFGQHAIDRVDVPNAFALVRSEVITFLDFRDKVRQVGGVPAVARPHGQLLRMMHLSRFSRDQPSLPVPVDKEQVLQGFCCEVVPLVRRDLAEHVVSDFVLKAVDQVFRLPVAHGYRLICRIHCVAESECYVPGCLRASPEPARRSVEAAISARGIMPQSHASCRIRGPVRATGRSRVLPREHQSLRASQDPTGLHERVCVWVSEALLWLDVRATTTTTLCLSGPLPRTTDLATSRWRTSAGSRGATPGIAIVGLDRRHDRFGRPGARERRDCSATARPVVAGCCLRTKRSSALGGRFAASRERVVRSRVAQLERQAGAGMHHRRAPGVDGGNDLLRGDPLQVGAGRGQMRVPELPLDQRQRDPLTQQLESGFAERAGLVMARR